ncbi:DUF3892 domain-containing protein [Curtobacterium sp. VKM Ac-2887]|uniref:DUF3892 domain-containing protein n=1 Tax=Curtobacterium sp. VKM Ac-2887 TaxID=2783819 RepID=UPI001E5697B5|nr:DUF3892 domain-containing protein [Curtobacterium sp. VKM Ac-2887]
MKRSGSCAVPKPTTKESTVAVQVTKSKKDHDGDITGLCGDGWSHSKSEAVSNIRTNASYYYVSVGGRTVNVRVGQRGGRDYLTTSADDYSPNNLDDLDDC